MSCSIIWRGTIPWEAVDYTIDFDEFGVAGSTINVQYQFDSPGAAAMKIAGIKVHPVFGWLKRKKATIKREEANLASASITFEGVPPNTDERTYKVKHSTSSEDIKTHPDFATWVEEGICSLSADKKTVIWKEESEGVKDSFFGTESWLTAGIIYEETWVRGNVGGGNELSLVGRIDQPPASNVLPRGAGGRNYLLISGDIEPIGFGTKMVRQWRMSGRRGWNSRIY